MSQNRDNAWHRDLQRRTFLWRSGLSLGGLALALLEGRAVGASGGRLTGLTKRELCHHVGTGDDRSTTGAVRELHHPPKVKRIIHLCMAGGPSQFESLDPKPRLDELNGQDFPASFTAGQQLAQLQNTRLVARGSFTKFSKHGESGQEVSSLFPETAAIADDICIIRSMHTEQINHDPAHAFMNSGSIIKGRPSMGSWLLYGLGSETENLPGFIVLTSTSNCGGAQPVSARQWSAGFLPSRFQGVQFQSRGAAVHYVGNPEGVCQSTQRQVIDEINRMNRLSEQGQTDPELETRISQYEMAARMQLSVPELTDFSDESAETLASYGVTKPGDGSFASNCLLARRMAERGVRMIQLYHRAWDHHGNIEKDMPVAAGDVDRAGAALVRDLKQRGLLDDTLVLWGGEFGRTPMGQGSGRDHHISSFSVWLAGGGIRGGTTWGATDELGYRAVDNPVSVHDLHATILHLFGIDHTRLTRRHQGRDFRLTDVSGEVVQGILA